MVFCAVFCVLFGLVSRGGCLSTLFMVLFSRVWCFVLLPWYRFLLYPACDDLSDMWLVIFCTVFLVLICLVSVLWCKMCCISDTVLSSIRFVMFCTVYMVLLCLLSGLWCFVGIVLCSIRLAKFVLFSWYCLLCLILHVWCFMLFFWYCFFYHSACDVLQYFLCIVALASGLCCFVLFSWPRFF